jgi:hypothetical protein
METSVLMQRQLFNCEIRQNSKTTFFCLNDLEKAGNHFRALNKTAFFSLNSWINSQPTKEFISELEKQFGNVLTSKRGKNGETWAHPLLFIDMALAIEPKLKIEAYKFLMDELLKVRNNSGDSYKKMCGALFENCNNKSNFHRGISITARLIQEACNVKDWQQATENQLKLRDKIHENIALLCDVLRDNNQAIRIGIAKTITK